MILIITTISSILAEGNDTVALNLCCYNSDLYDEAKFVVNLLNNLLKDIDRPWR